MHLHVCTSSHGPTQPISTVSEPVTAIGHFQGSRGFLLGWFFDGMPRFRICTPSTCLTPSFSAVSYARSVTSGSVLQNGERGCYSCVHPSIHHDPCAEHASLLLANCSSAENELGFEWVLMEKIEVSPWPISGTECPSTQRQARR